jgi:hypothetical protein
LYGSAHFNLWDILFFDFLQLNNIKILNVC